MCYDVVSATRQLLKYAIHRGDIHHAEELERKLFDLTQATLKSYNHVSGFEHPGLLVFTDEKPLEPQVFYWGLIPPWIKDPESAKKIMNQTLNARAETIFEKPAFKFSAKNKRCLVYLDAFFEHHHFNKQTYPFYINPTDGSPLVVAGLWNDWVDRSTGEIHNTVSIVTTEANGLMKYIHNNPKNDGARMPVILKKEDQEKWLSPTTTENDIEILKSLFAPIEDTWLKSHTTGKLKGKNAIGNNKEAQEPFEYPELALEQAFLS